MRNYAIITRQQIFYKVFDIITIVLWLYFDRFVVGHTNDICSEEFHFDAKSIDVQKSMTGMM